MQLNINLPDDVAKFLQENPDAGRRMIERRFKINSGLARTYSAISKFLAMQNENPDFAEGMDIKNQEALHKQRTNATEMDFPLIRKTEIKVDKEFIESPEKELIVEDKETKKDGKCKVIEYRGERPYTEKELIEMANINMFYWEKAGLVVNSWDVTTKHGTRYTNYQTKLTLKPKPVTVLSLEKALKNFKKWLKRYKPETVNINPRYVRERNYAGEMAIFDAHIGKFAWYKETMQGNWDLEIACKTFIDNVRELLEFLVPFQLSKIFFPIGNDIMHAENIQPLTPKGRHVLDVDGRLPKTIEYTKRTMFQAIDMILQVAPLEVIWVPGNHDPNASHWLCHILEAWYHTNKHVTVDLSPEIHKARIWGDLLVGYTHAAAYAGQQNRVINMLPQFWPKEWGQSQFREWHTGHKHRKVTTKTAPVLTLGGCVIRQFPTLSPIDFWHLESAFVDAIPASQALLWDKTGGVVSEFTAITHLNTKSSVYTQRGN